MIRYITTIAVILLSYSAIGQQGAKDAPAVDYTLRGASMPFFKMTILDTAKKKTPVSASASKKKRREESADTVLVAGHITSQEYGPGRGNLFVMLFSPVCEHCEAMTDLLQKNIALLKDTKLVLMTNPKFMEYTPGFMKKMHTLEYPQMKVGLDDSDFIKQVFLYQSLPQINIYGSDRKLITTFTGDTPFDSLKQFIN